MTKTDLVDKIVQSTGCSKADAERQIDAVVGGIKALTTGVKEKLVIRGFGTFERKYRAGHTGRNPQTGEPIEIAGSERLTFKASKS